MRGITSTYNAVDCLPRAYALVLQFNGRFDTDFRFTTSAKPFLDRLGTNPEDKPHVVDSTRHFVALTVSSAETPDWLDKHLGPLD
jgi:hypothetical protein